MLPSPFVRALPKVQLHCHLEGTLRAATFLELTARYGLPVRYRPEEPEGQTSAGPPVTAANVYRFADFGEFLLTFAAVSRALREPDDYRRLAQEYAQDAIAQNVVYGELFVSPSVWQFFHPNLDVRACVRAIREAFDAARTRGGIELRLIVDLTRNFGVESAMRTARLAVELAEFGVVGIGLGGDEARFAAELFERPFAYARAAALHVVAHAGEAAGAQSVRAAIEVLGAERIGHGIRALEDPQLVELLARRGVALEICPTSNFLTGAARVDAPHPLFALDAAGVLVTIDADDPALFGTSITQEYAYVAAQAGERTLLRLVGNAVEASFAPEGVKAALRAALREPGLELR